MPLGASNLLPQKYVYHVLLAVPLSLDKYDWRLISYGIISTDNIIPCAQLLDCFVIHIDPLLGYPTSSAAPQHARY